MKPTPQQLRAAQAAFIGQHGLRVRRCTAMRLLTITHPDTFKKVVDANPQLKHKHPGETQPKYLTHEIFALLPVSAWCATGGEG